MNWNLGNATHLRQSTVNPWYTVCAGQEDTFGAPSLCIHGKDVSAGKSCEKCATMLRVMRVRVRHAWLEGALMKPDELAWREAEIWCGEVSSETVLGG